LALLPHRIVLISFGLLLSELYIPPPGSGTGLGWTNAYTNIQDALTIAISGTHIWVADGVYFPDEGGGQLDDAVTSTFTLKEGVALYGGFGGYGISETLRTQRDWENYKTILSGDIDHETFPDTTDSIGVVTTTSNITGTNAYHVVFSDGADESAVLDGFTITAGWATNGSPNNTGGGMYNYSSDPTLANLTFSGNWASSGGGMFNHWYSSPTITNVTFTGNSAGHGGGGMYNHTNSNPILMNIVFSGNSVSNYGGGLYNYSSDPSLTNVTFTGNHSAYSGGGMCNATNSDPTFINVTFSGNFAPTYGGGIYNSDNSNPKLINTILWGNNANNSGEQIFNSNSTPVISYTLIQSSTIGGIWDTSLGTDGGNNLDENPLFMRNPDPGDGDWTTNDDNDYGNLHLQAGSPAIDTGDDSVCPSTDLYGNTRPAGAGCDIGAIEFFFKIFLPVVLKMH